MYQKTVLCVERATALLERGDEDSLRYACLQLRMGIERAFYALVPVYADELPTDILKRWQPKQVIDAITDCDPNAGKDVRLTILDSEERSLLARDQKAVTKHLIKEYWHKLGSFLHASMQHVDVDLPKLKLFLLDTIAALREFTTSNVIANIRRSVAVQCECGRTINRNAEALEIKPRVTCPDIRCGAMYDYAEKDGLLTFTPVVVFYDCPRCKTVNYLGAHRVSDDFVITCCECETKMRVQKEFVIRMVS
ncbi:MAG TPA: hypothetical protein VGG64_14200 [Pirellulales bacterium]|jgi:hypothetical protein